MRVSSSCALAAVALLLSLGAPAAHAATVVSSFEPADSVDGDTTFTSYTAGSDESAHLQVHVHGNRVRFHDPGVVIQPTGDCVRIDEHTADCLARAHKDFGAAMDVRLSDRANSVTIVSGRFRQIDVQGGSGPDRIDARRAHGGVGISGGLGHDVLLGGPGRDTIEVADGDRVFAGLGNDEIDVAGLTYECPTHGADRIDGGPGNDTVAYDCFSQPVHVDLAHHSGTAHGMHDRLTTVENASAVANGSVLRGDGKANRLTAEGTGDVLNGRGGNDHLVVSDGGSASLDGGAGNDTLVFELEGVGGVSVGRVRCGSGVDRLVPDGSLVVPLTLSRDCEGIGTPGGPAILPPPSRLAADGLHLSITCGPHPGHGHFSAKLGLAVGEHDASTIERPVGRLGRSSCPPRRRAVTIPVNAAGLRAALRHGRSLYLEVVWRIGFQELELRFDRHGRLRG